MDARYRTRAAAEADPYRELGAKREERQAQPDRRYSAWNDTSRERGLSDPVNWTYLTDRESEPSSGDWGDLDGAPGTHSTDYDQLRAPGRAAAEFCRACESNTGWRKRSLDAGLVETFEADRCISLMRLS